MSWKPQKERWKQCLPASWWACRRTPCPKGHKPVRKGYLTTYASCSECGSDMHRTTEPQLEGA